MSNDINHIMVIKQYKETYKEINCLILILKNITIIFHFSSDYFLSCKVNMRVIYYCETII